MRIDPQLRALRSDTAPQRKAQIALEAARDAWAHGPARSVLEQLESYGSKGDLADYPALSGLFGQAGTASALIEALMASLLDEVRAHPLGQVPLRHQYKDGLSVLQIAQRGRAALSLITYEEPEVDPTSVCFAGGERHEAVLAGSADICEFELLAEAPGRASIDCRTRRAVAGEYLLCEGEKQTRQIRQVHGRFVVLRLSRTEEVPPETRQYSLAGGRLLHRASGCRAESQREMATALLGRMGRSDVAPLLARLTKEGSDHIRWQTLRECLALDTVEGFGALSAIARNPADPLATPAGALMAQLVEAHPQLSQIEVSQCPV